MPFELLSMEESLKLINSKRRRGCRSNKTEDKNIIRPGQKEGESDKEYFERILIPAPDFKDKKIRIIDLVDAEEFLDTRALNRLYGLHKNIRGYLPDDLREKYSKEFWETRKIFFEKFWNTAHCKGKKWHSKKTCWLENDKWIYVDGAKMTIAPSSNGEKRYYNWETMNLERYTEDYSEFELEIKKLDKAYKSYKGFYVVLCCKELGIFCFTAQEFLDKVMTKGKLSSFGDIHWNVFPRNEGKELWLIISSGDKFEITERRNNLDVLT